MGKPETCNFEGFDIPIELMLLTGGGPDTFAEISRAHIENLERHVGLRPEFSILEMGCGIGRDAIPLTKKISPRGRYLGIDIIRPSIDWCRANISKRFPNFQFVHFDVKDELHNNVGTISTQDVRIPLSGRSVDRIILQSVFTHLMRRDIEHVVDHVNLPCCPSGSTTAHEIGRAVRNAAPRRLGGARSAR